MTNWSNNRDLIDVLRKFNRKERFYLVGQMLGNPSFELANEVLTEIEALIGTPVIEPYFAAMDYHFDWIYASLVLAFANPEFPKPAVQAQGCLTATQEDVDFLIAFKEANEQFHIVMIEAKGDNSFTNKQLKSKSVRLQAIFGDDGQQWPRVTPHFLICSPRAPARIDVSEFPAFMTDSGNKLLWFALHMPQDNLKVTRCDPLGKKNKDGGCWSVDNFATYQASAKAND